MLRYEAARRSGGFVNYLISTYFAGAAVSVCSFLAFFFAGFFVVSVVAVSDLSFAAFLSAANADVPRSRAPATKTDRTVLML